MIQDIQKDTEKTSVFKDAAVKKFKAPKRNIFTIDWSQSGKNLATGDSYVTIWDYDNQSGELTNLKSYKSHSGTIEQVAWHPKDPNILASASYDSTMKIWDIRQKNAVRSESNAEHNFNLAWNNDGTMIAVSNKSNSVTFFETRLSGQNKSQTRNFSFEILSLAWDMTDSVFILAGSQSNRGTIQILDGQDPLQPILEVFEGHRAKINTIAIDPLKRYFATGGMDSIVSVWNLYEMNMVKTFTETEDIITKLSFSHDGKYLGVASEKSSMDIYNVNTGNHAFELDKLAQKINAIKWHPNQSIVAFDQEGEVNILVAHK